MLTSNERFQRGVVNSNTRFFYKQHFYKQRQVAIGKNQASTNQNPETELLLFKNYSHSSSTLSSKNNMTYSKK